jgi:hypothetical protein
MDLVMLMAVAAAIVAAAFVAGHTMRSEDRDGILTETLRGWRQPGWPHGVQEEEPVRLNLAAATPVPSTAPCDCTDATPRAHVSRRNAFPVRVA